MIANPYVGSTHQGRSAHETQKFKEQRFACPAFTRKCQHLTRRYFKVLHHKVKMPVRTAQRNP